MDTTGPPGNGRQALRCPGCEIRIANETDLLTREGDIGWFSYTYNVKEVDGSFVCAKCDHVLFGSGEVPKGSVARCPLLLQLSGTPVFKRGPYRVGVSWNIASMDHYRDVFILRSKYKWDIELVETESATFSEPFLDLAIVGYSIPYLRLLLFGRDGDDAETRFLNGWRLTGGNVFLVASGDAIQFYKSTGGRENSTFTLDTPAGFAKFAVDAFERGVPPMLGAAGLVRDHQVLFGGTPVSESFKAKFPDMWQELPGWDAEPCPRWHLHLLIEALQGRSTQPGGWALGNYRPVSEVAADIRTYASKEEGGDGTPNSHQS